MAPRQDAMCCVLAGMVAGALLFGAIGRLAPAPAASASIFDLQVRQSIAPATPVVFDIAPCPAPDAVRRAVFVPVSVPSAADWLDDALTATTNRSHHRPRLPL